jgi:glycosyltransferase involved in cell wall biosynthesis
MQRKVRLIVRLSEVLGIRLVSASRWIEASIGEVCRLPRSAAIVHNGCDVEAIGARAAAVRVGRRHEEAVVGMISRLDPIKDHKTLLAAFARLPAVVGGRPTRLVLVGDGGLRAPLEAQALELGIADQVTFAGARSDVPELLAGFDVFAFSTTRDEGFGVVLIEALAAGTPIVASDVPACREVLEGGALGRLVPPSIPEALAETLNDLLTHPPAVPDRPDVERRYGVAAMADAYLAVLFSVRAGPGPRVR